MMPTDQDQPAPDPALPAPLSEDEIVFRAAGFTFTLEELAESDDHLRWVLRTHQPAEGKSFCPVCDLRAPCDLVSLAGTALYRAAALDATRQELAVAQEQAAEENRHRARAVREGFRLAQDRDTARAEVQRLRAVLGEMVDAESIFRVSMVFGGQQLEESWHRLREAADLAAPLTTTTPSAPVAQAAADAGEGMDALFLVGYGLACEICGQRSPHGHNGAELASFSPTPPADHPAGGEHGSE